MSIQPGNLLTFSKGGGGLIGKGKVCRLDNFKILEHSLEKKDKTTGAVLERYPAALFAMYDINVLDDNVEDDKRHATQFVRVGRLPLWRAQALNSIDPQRDANYPGGFLASTDNQNPTTEGPFILFDGESGIWEGEDYAVFMGELVQLGFLTEGGADRMAKQGIACLNGIVVKLDEKAKPKGKKSDPTKQARTVMVPVQVIQWPWSTKTAAAAVVAAASPAVQPPVVASMPSVPPVSVPAAAPAILPPASTAAVAAPGPVVTSPNGGAGFDTAAIDYIKAAAKASGGVIQNGNLLTTVFPLTKDLEGTDRAQIMSRVNNPEFIKAAAAAGHFLLDPTGTVMVM